MTALARRLAPVASAALVLASAPLSGARLAPPQSAQQPGQAEQPRFRTTTELVVVDVSAIGKDGTPVKGLQAGDFTVRIDGGPRRIASIKFVDQSAPETTADAARPVVRYSSNESGGAGRLILILVDESSIRFGGLRAAAESIDRLLAGFGPSDRVALVTLPGPRMLVEFTADHQRIAAAIKTIPGGAVADAPRAEYYVSTAEAFAIDSRVGGTLSEVIARECPATGAKVEALDCSITIEMEAKRIVMTERNRTAEFVSGLSGFLTGLRAIDAPKLVVVFSEGFASPESPNELVALGRDAALARAVIYAMRLDRSMFDVSRPRRGPLTDDLDERRAATAGLDALTGSARGTTFEVIGSAENPFKRLAAEVSGYYLIGVEPEGTDRDGKLHQIRVDVNRPGVTVRARRDFAFRPVVTDETKVFAGAIASPLLATELPLRVATFNLADEDPSKVHVLVVAEIGRAVPQQGSATVGFVLTDEKGKSALTTGRRMTLSKGGTDALLFTGKFPVPAGTYTMKFAAVYDGRAGSVEHRVVARLTPPEAAAAKPAGSAPQIGDLIILPSAAVPGAIAPPLDGRVRGDWVAGFAQIGVDPRAKADRSYLFDVVKQEQGPALVSVAGRLDPAAKGRSRIVEANVDARLLPPGEYGLRLTVTAGGTPVATLFTPFSLERPAPAGRPAAPAGATRPAPADAAKFKPQDALDPQVLAPFLDEVARFAPEPARAALEQAKSGQFDEALQRLKPGGASDPTAPFLRGLSLFAKGQNDPAAIAFREAIGAAPQLLVGAFYIGACYAAGGKETQAINAWQTSLIGLGQHQAVYRFLADALMRAGQSERARALLEQAVSRWPDDEALQERAMRANLESGRNEKALEYADKIIERRPSDTATLFLAMRSIFQAVLDGTDARVDVMLPRLQRYQELYAAAGGPQQALTAEWVAFVRARAGVFH